VLAGLTGSWVPTSMERLASSSLFDVSVLSPPAPLSPPQSPRPPPPPLSASPAPPPPDMTFDFLFDDTEAEAQIWHAPPSAAQAHLQLDDRRTPPVPSKVPSTRQAPITREAPSARQVPSTRQAPIPTSSSRIGAANDGVKGLPERQGAAFAQQSFGLLKATHVSNDGSLWPFGSAATLAIGVSIGLVTALLAVSVVRASKGPRRERVPTVDIDMDGDDEEPRGVFTVGDEDEELDDAEPYNVIEMRAVTRI